MSVLRKIVLPMVPLGILLVACTTTGPESRPAEVPTDSSKPVVVALANDAQRAQEQGRYEQAASYLERALRIDPTDALLWHRLAKVRFSQGRLQQAVHLAAKSNSVAGTNQALQRRNWRLLADAWTALGREDKAEAARRRAQE